MVARNMGYDNIEIRASGTKAHKIRHLTSPMKIRHQIIGLANNLGVYDENERDIVEQVLDEGPNAEPNEENRILYARGLQIIRTRGGLFIGYALGEIGIEPTANVFQPTVPCESHVILGMKDNNVNDLIAMYGTHEQRELQEKRGYSPLITTFQEFAEAAESVPDPMGKGIKEYQQLRDYFMEHSPFVLDKLVNHCAQIL